MGNDYIIDEDFLLKYVNCKDTDPCICGSGMPFSGCHKLTGNEARDQNLYQIHKRIRKIKKPRRCFHTDQDCRGEFANSHSIPRQSLENIQEDRHVLRFEANNRANSPEQMKDFSLEPDAIGINEVGCFFGFCNNHDTTVFSPIETKEIVPTGYQAALTRYRALCKEIYVKNQTTKLIPIMKDIAASKPSAEASLVLATFSAQFFSGTFRALAEFYRELDLLRKVIAGKVCSPYRNLTYIFDSYFPVQTCSYANPIFSPSGRLIQDWNDFTVDGIYYSLNSFFRDGKTYVMFTWVRGTNFDKFFEEFAQLIGGREANYLCQFIFAHSENHAFRPSWWNSLSVIKKKRIERLFLQDILDHQTLTNPFANFRNLDFTDSKLLHIIWDAAF